MVYYRITDVSDLLSPQAQAAFWREAVEDAWFLKEAEPAYQTYLQAPSLPLQRAQRMGAIRLLVDLSRTLGAEISLPCFSIAENGKPFFPNLKFAFNFSHSYHLSACAVCVKAGLDREDGVFGSERAADVGIDIERIVSQRTHMDALARRWFSPEDQALWEAAPKADRTELFYLLWAKRESISKWKGCGLSALPAEEPSSVCTQREIVQDRNGTSYALSVAFG